MGELKDQFGKSHKLEDYKGKVIFLNFWQRGADHAAAKCRKYRNCMKNTRYGE